MTSPRRELSSLDLLTNIHSEDLAALIDLATEISAEPGQRLVHESDEGEEIFLLVSGRVDIEVAHPETGEGQVIATLKPGDILGESILLEQRRRLASARARDKVTALRWNRADLMALFDSNQRLAYRFMFNISRALSSRLGTTNMLLRNAFAELNIPLY